jgi:hypothetical protein
MVGVNQIAFQVVSEAVDDHEGSLVGLTLRDPGA